MVRSNQRIFTTFEFDHPPIIFLQYMANFEDSMKLLEPQLNALIVASANIQRSERLKELLEIILCFGNYMNAGRRGPAYGFKVKV